MRKLSMHRGLKLDTILNTHHHYDHTGGNLELKQHYRCQIVGPKADKDRIPGIDIALGDGDTWRFGDLEMRVFDTPGHTRGHITLWFPAAEALFPGLSSTVIVQPLRRATAGADDGLSCRCACCITQQEHRSHHSSPVHAVDKGILGLVAAQAVCSQALAVAVPGGIWTNYYR